MDDGAVPSESVLKQIVMTIQEPVAFHGLLKDKDGRFIWDILNWDLPKMAEIFGDKKLPFRVGYNAKSVNPQWEVECSIELMNLQDFIAITDNIVNNNKWYYFDYKYMHEWLKDRPDIIESLSWQRFGFDQNGSDSTMWIGSKGAHTNCHQDSYGCNLVAQVYGRKQWLLFPPSCTNALQPSRDPYEESTIYSKINIFAPKKESQETILTLSDCPRLITLSPGDVLFVPNGWWHYVESLELSISVNTWLPIPKDRQSRLEESLVKLLVSRIGKKQCLMSREHAPTLTYCMSLVENSLKECKGSYEDNVPVSEKKTKYSVWTVEDLQREYPTCIKQLVALDKMELKKFLAEKNERFSTNIEEQPGSTRDTGERNDEDITTTVINALCHPDIVQRVAHLLATGCL